MTTIIEAQDRFVVGGRPPVDPGGGGGDDGSMNERVAVIEARLDNLATKAELSETKGTLLAAIERGISETQRWIIGTVIGLFLGFGGLFLAMSNALKPAPTTQPTVIIVPAGAMAGAAAAQPAASAALAPASK